MFPRKKMLLNISSGYDFFSLGKGLFGLFCQGTRQNNNSMVCVRRQWWDKAEWLLGSFKKLQCFRREGEAVGLKVVFSFALTHLTADFKVTEI